MYSALSKVQYMKETYLKGINIFEMENGTDGGDNGSDEE